MIVFSIEVDSGNGTTLKGQCRKLNRPVKTLTLAIDILDQVRPWTNSPDR